MSRYVLSKEAQADLRDIRDYIAKDSLRAAQRVLSEFTEAFRGLSQMPRKGHVREDLTARKDVRFWPVYSYLVIYRPDKKPLEIVAILHGMRDVKRVLGERD